MKPELKDYINGWISKAENDLATAQRCIEIEPMILDNACFNCQQAIEKYLKAYLAYNHRAIEKTHNVNFLLDECIKLDKDFNTIDVKDINAYAVQIRYPDDAIIPSADEARDYFKIALEVKQLVLKKIKL